jgi:hypothetical protein
MNAVDVQDLLFERLAANGVAGSIHHELSQVLDFQPEGFFVEVVLRDAAKIPRAERAILEVTEALKGKGIELNGLVRAIWEVKDVQSEGAAYGPSGAPRAASRLRVLLRSGEREESVHINVTWLAVEELRRRTGTSGQQERELLRALVAEFVKMELELGGMSYWDPTRFPEKDLKAAAMSYLLGLERVFPFAPSATPAEPAERPR